MGRPAGKFAVASASRSVPLDEFGRCTEVRICLTAAAPVPWRAPGAERWLIGKPLMMTELRRGLDAELNACAHLLSRNVWKVDAVAGLGARAFDALTQSPGPIKPATVGTEASIEADRQESGVGLSSI